VSVKVSVTLHCSTDSSGKTDRPSNSGLSAVTLDKQYQSQRRMRQFRNKPKHALYGVSAGAASLLTSVASGFEGVVVSLSSSAFKVDQIQIGSSSNNRRSLSKELNQVEHSDFSKE
jgi:hypothetical protein